MANAGSGKTTCLTQRVVRLLLLGVKAESIVCITYTKAAASEMRERILLRLRQLFLANESECIAQLEKLKLSAPTPEMLARAKALFPALLDSPQGGVQITTIHGFCQNILRRFPVEAGIVPHFTVLEEAMADSLLREASMALLNKADDDPWLRDALMLLGARGGESRFNSFTADILKKRTLWQRIWHGQAPSSLREHIWALHGLSADVDEASLNQRLVAMLDASDEAIVRAHLPEMLADKRVGLRGIGEGLAKWLALEEAQRADSADDLIDVFLTKEDRTIRKSLVDKKRHPNGSPLARVMNEWAARALELYTERAALACAEETFAVAMLARTLDQEYREAKARVHALDYDDLIDATLTLMKSPDMMGWVMRKLDHRIEHLLIDEAQDNSLKQWELAYLLVDELIASKNAPRAGGLPASLLVVGDEKQSIYSFQGAAPEAFAEYQRQFEERLAHSDAPLVNDTLENSYRSTASVLKLVDAVCALPAITRAISSDGVLAQHKLIRDKAHDCGKVLLYPLLTAEEKTTLPPLEIPKTYAVVSTLNQRLADKIAHTIEGWLKQQRPLISEQRALHAGDILILVRKRTGIVPQIILALERRGVAVAGIDRLKLSRHLAVRDLLALMQWCLNESDDLALAQVLRSPLIGMSDAQLCAIAHPREGTLWQAMEDDWLTDVRAKRTLSPYDFLTEVLEVSNKRQQFVARFGEEVHEVLDELKAQAAMMPSGMPQTLAYFHDWLSNSVREIKRESAHGGGDAVRVMTVHGAKGLEAPIVILADTTDVPTTSREMVFPITSQAKQQLAALSISSISKHAPQLTAAKEAKKQTIIAEYQRLLYVAITRARDELHIFGATSKKTDVDDASWYHTLREAMRACAAGMDDHGVMTLRDPIAQEEMTFPATIPAPLAGAPAWVTTPAARDVETAQNVTDDSHPSLAVSGYGIEAANDATERGVRIHRLFELFQGYHTAEDLAAMVAYLCPDWDGEACANLIASMLKLREAEPWLWQHPRRVEVNITGQVEQAGVPQAVSRQIDLLIETPDEILILDYKTSPRVPAEVMAIPEPYVAQLRSYRALVAPLYPALPIRCGIIWTAQPRIMWLPEAVLMGELSV